MGRDGLSVVEKISAIVTLFIEEDVASMSFNDILEGSGLPRATTHRLLSDLTGEGFLAQEAERDVYRLGPLLMSLAFLARERTGLIAQALPRMTALRDRFGETVIVAELDGDAVVPVRRVDGLHEMRMNQEVGHRYPAHAGGTGKVLLAHQDPAWLERYLDTVELTRLTDATVETVASLRTQLAEIAKVGVAVSIGERVPEAFAVATPIFDASGRAQAALTISGLASRFDEARLVEAALAVKEAAAGVSNNLGFRPSVEAAGPPPQAALERMCRRAVRQGRAKRRAASA